MYSLPPLSVLNSRRTSLTHILHRREEQNRAFSISTERSRLLVEAYLSTGFSKKTGMECFPFSTEHSLYSARPRVLYVFSIRIHVITHSYFGSKPRAHYKTALREKSLDNGLDRARTRTLIRTHARTNAHMHAQTRGYNVSYTLYL